MQAANIPFGTAYNNQLVNIKLIVEPMFRDFCKLAVQIPKHPENKLCSNLAQALVKHYENPTEET
jgi:hypothetical protein